MPTPKYGYTMDGEKIPSVTTILSRFKESGGLIHWAWSVGFKGEDYRDARRTAMNVGTCAHKMVECFIRNVQFDESAYPLSVLASANQAFTAFRRWSDQSSLKPAGAEVSLISRRYRYGGMLDAITLGDNLHLLDWKNSTGIYGEYLLQLAAYGQLWNENNPDRPVRGYDIVQFSKETGDFSHRSFVSLKDELTEFLLLRKAYELDLRLKERI